MSAITVTSPQRQRELRELYEDLRPGDRVEVEHTVTVGLKQWTTKRTGTVVRTERMREGLHFRRNFDDKVFADTIYLQSPDGELTAVTLDEFTTLRRVLVPSPRPASGYPGEGQGEGICRIHDTISRLPTGFALTLTLSQRARGPDYLR